MCTGISDCTMVSSESSEFFRFGMDHRLPLLLCVYCFIPAISLLIVRELFLSGEGDTYNWQVRIVVGYMFSALSSMCFLVYAYPMKEIIHMNIYLVSASFMALFVLVISYGWRRKPEVRLGIVIAYLGIGLSFVSTAVSYWYEESSEITFVTYIVGLFIFFVGLVIVNIILLK